jgi:hypothetical protein
MLVLTPASVDLFERDDITTYRSATTPPPGPWGSDRPRKGPGGRYRLCEQKNGSYVASGKRFLQRHSYPIPRPLQLIRRSGGRTLERVPLSMDAISHEVRGRVVLRPGLSPRYCPRGWFPGGRGRRGAQGGP